MSARARPTRSPRRRSIVSIAAGWTRSVGIAMSLFVALTAAPAYAGKFADRIVRVTDPNAPRSLPDAGPVSVRWDDPAKFSELRGSQNRYEAERGDWVADIARYLRKQVERKLPEGERLEVAIVDIRRAGNYEPWHGFEYRDVRIMRELYWPQIELAVKRTAADGSVVSDRSYMLSDPAYLGSATRASEGDPLRYEKALIDRWVRRELVAPSVAQTR